MLHQGVYLAPSQFEAAFVSTAHTDEIVDQTIAAKEKPIARLVISLRKLARNLDNL